jgi:hypothetical protein
MLFFQRDAGLFNHSCPPREHGVMFAQSQCDCGCQVFFFLVPSRTAELLPLTEKRKKAQMTGSLSFFLFQRRKSFLSLGRLPSYLLDSLITMTVTVREKQRRPKWREVWFLFLVIRSGKEDVATPRSDKRKPAWRWRLSFPPPRSVEEHAAEHAAAQLLAALLTKANREEGLFFLSLF